MDIGVSRLNTRLVLQVPAELPLGLVFITGRVEGLKPVSDHADVFGFDLVERQSRLSCRIPRGVAEETLLQEGDRVRVGGRLVFARHSVQYCLLARDIEVLPLRTSDGSLQPVLADIRQREQQTSLAQAELPPWVRRLAPPELREELEVAEASFEVTNGAPSIDEHFEDSVPGIDLLPQELVSYLARALDSDAEVELTPEMIAAYLPETEGTLGDTEAENQESAARQRRAADAGQPATTPATATSQVEEPVADLVADGGKRAAASKRVTRTRRDVWVPRLEIAAIVLLTLLLVASMVTLILLLSGS